MLRYLILLLLMIVYHGTKAQSLDKDTLFFKLDKKYIIQSLRNENEYFLKDSNEDGTFFFVKDEVYKKLKNEKRISLKKYVRKSKYYNRSSFRKLNDLRLMEHFEKYVIFLIKDDDFIKVIPGHGIE